jgi:hypothetical protein
VNGLTMKNKQIGIPAFSIPLGILVAGVSYTALYTPGFYPDESPNWQVQALGQDAVDLFLVVPCLLLSGMLAFRGHAAARYVWGGTLLYLAYTFVLYCFDIRFNSLFPFYCAGLGLSCYGFLFFVVSTLRHQTLPSPGRLVSRILAIYLLVLSLLFGGLWLSEIIPAILSDTVPASVNETGLPTNGVHVLDLSLLLPLFFLTGVWLLRGKPVAFLLAPALLAFSILMDITIALLTLEMKINGMAGDNAVAYAMVFLALASTALLVLFTRNPSSAKAPDSTGS